MLTYGPIFRKYGVQTTFRFALQDVSDAEAPFTGVAPLAADIWISKDGGAAANATNAAVAISNGFYAWTATAAEMQAANISISIYDATASAIFLPVYIMVETELALGNIVVDASQKTNTHAVSVAGVGTGSGINTVGGVSGHGLYAQGGATIGNGIEGRATASAYAGFAGFGFGTGDGMSLKGGLTGHGLEATGGDTTGNGFQGVAVGSGYAGIAGFGAGTGPGISGAGGPDGHGMRVQGGSTAGVGLHATGTGGNNGFSGIATGAGRPSNFLSGELLEDITGPPNPGTTSVAQAIAALIARFYYLVTQTSTQQKQYKSDSATLVGTSTVSDDGVTQTKGKSA